MNYYSIPQWILIFFAYCFLGWCYETIFVSVTEKRFINRGFLRSPFLPIYGFGAIIMILSGKPFFDDPVSMFICGALSATLMEYAAGWIMELFFKTRFWDYSDCRYNVSGRICAEATFLWGFMTLLVNYKIHVHIEGLILKLDKAAAVILATILMIIFAADFIISVKSALDIANVLKRLTEIKHELARLTERLNQNLEAHKAGTIKESIEKLQQEHSEIFKKLNFLKRNFINAHPRAQSKKFNVALTELKEKIRKNSNKK